MGEVIAFEPEKGGLRMRARPEGSAMIVIFTDVWHEPVNGRARKKRRVPILRRTSVHESCAKL
jgi:hypothetical protein